MNPERICYGCFSEKEPGAVCPVCGFDETKEQPYLALPLGTIVNGRYLIGKVLGIGGFGITYLGFDLTLEIKVAIKEYMPSAMATRNNDRYTVVLTGHQEKDYQYGMERFLEEARILAKLQNTPNIVSVQNYFQENNTAYFVMEYVDGTSLKAYLAAHSEKISCDEALKILLPVMNALVSVHSRQLLHRDISPDNIYLTANGDSRLLDFGAARFAAGDGKSVSVILKHGYAPEEQYSSHGNQGPWTDVYAMGATLYRCITGTLPPDSIERIHNDTIKRPSELGVSISPAAEQALMKALSVRTQDRFMSMEAFICALTGDVNDAPQQPYSGAGATTSAYPESTATATSSRAAAFFTSFSTRLKQNPLLAVALGGAFVAVIALVIFLPLSGKSGKNGGYTNSASSQGTSTASALPGSDAQSPSETQPGQNPNAPDDNSDNNSGSSNGSPNDSDRSTDSSDVTSVTYDLGVLNATIDVPADYTVSDSGFTFTNDAKNCQIETSFNWATTIPIYSLADIEDCREDIVSSYADGYNLTNAMILTAGPDDFAGQSAYQIFFQGTDSSQTTFQYVLLAVEGRNGFGAYLLVGSYPKDSEADHTQIYNSLTSFRINGPVDITYDRYCDTSAGVQFITDSARISSTKRSSFTLPNGNSGTALVLFLSSNNEEYIEAEQGLAAGKNAEECIAYLSSIWEDVSGASLSEIMTESYGDDITWQFRIVTHDSGVSIFAAADIDGTPYIVGASTSEENIDNSSSILSEVISTLRPL